MIRILYDEFETYCREQLGLSQHSLRAYRQDLKAFQKFASSLSLGAWPSHEQIICYQKHLRENEDASPSTIRRRMVTLRSYFRWLCERENVSASPFDGLRLDLKIPRRLPRPVDRQTLNSVFKSSKHLAETNVDHSLASSTQKSSEQVTGLVARLLLVTGMRVGEVTNLLARDVNGAGSRIRVRGKGNRERTVYVTNHRLLRDFRVHWDGRIRTDGANAPLFLNSRGKPLTAPAFRKRLRTISKTLLIEPHLTPHQFRHSAATLLIEEGVDIRIVQRLLGHASIATTEIYTKVSDNSLISAIERADTLAQVDQ
ncbi:tyrosine-type recombinase/integrase [Roseibium sp. Sym1]|uniref:tyrosine-type recombinase/integrase n=1 Tax=Roseibium sp. Sym1 TaxID=3016006 RepID=UPI0022B59FB5|nr:tyrosine-type recombinase/integrase [Roseibium sp. Sym1]